MYKKVEFCDNNHRSVPTNTEQASKHGWAKLAIKHCGGREDEEAVAWLLFIVDMAKSSSRIENFLKVFFKSVLKFKKKFQFGFKRTWKLIKICRNEHFVKIVQRK